MIMDYVVRLLCCSSIKEAFKSKPNRTTLRALIDGLISIFRNSPEMDKALSDAKSLTNYDDTRKLDLPQFSC